ncbi:MAG: glycosyltransferase [Flavobacteriales bacterium]
MDPRPVPPSGPLRVLVVGQTPPPFGGQAIMIEALLRADPVHIRLFHVRLNYSDEMDSVGKFALRKVWVLFTTILQVWGARLRHRTPMLYYPPSGPNMVPVLRDVIFLCATRWLFKWTVFHYHAGGVSGFEKQLPVLIRPFFRLAYRNAAMAIRTAPQNPEDGKLLDAKQDVVVPNGILDMRGTVQEHSAAPGEPVVILFTGVLIRSKGVRVLLEAFRDVVAQGADARLELMGRWGDRAFEEECLAYLAAHGLGEKVTFLGVMRDMEKFERFAGCDIFCFPSHFEAESFGLVLLEAMQFAKPVVTTRWRGIPSVAEDGVNGFVVPVEDPSAVAAKLLLLIKDEPLRKRMGEEGRRIFAERFTLERFQQNMEEALVAAAKQN